MAIDRGEIPEIVAEFYGLKFPFDPPEINDPDSLLQVAESLFINDRLRIEKGGKHFANPTIATVKVWVDKYKEKYYELTTLNNQHKLQIENIEQHRSIADNLINNYFPSKKDENVDKSQNKKGPSNIQLSLEL